MKRRELLLGSLAAAAMPLAAQAAPLNLPTLSNYINSLVAVEGKFTQINHDGTIATGKIFIYRPGRIRFEYDPPSRTLVLASAGTVAIFDGKSNTRPEEYPLSRTPLNLILERNVNLQRANMITAFEYDGTSTMIVAQDPKHPEYGNIRLKFTGPPPELRQWIITSGDGTRTTVILNDMRPVGGFNAAMFSIQSEMNRRGL